MKPVTNDYGEVKRLLCVASRVLILSLVSATGIAFGQDYPSRVVRILTNQTGGGGDYESRIIAKELAGRLGQQIIVDNRADALIGGVVARSKPDGHTLLIAGPTWAFAPLLGPADYDAIKDFSPISMLGTAPNVLVVLPGGVINSVKELIALVKSKPGVLNYATSGTGSSSHLAGELFMAMADLKIVRIPYAGGSAAINGVMGREANLSFSTVAAAMPQVKGGRLRALAHTGSRATPLVPGIPTLSESGLSGYELVSTDLIVAPAKTPKAIIQRLNQEIVWTLSQNEVKQKFFSSGVDAASSTPEELDGGMKTDLARMGKLIKDAGIRVN